MKIFKYSIDGKSLLLPKGAEILSAQIQNSLLCLWAKVDPTAPLEKRNIKYFGTGEELPKDTGVYIGTTQDGPFVWHIFEVPFF